MTRSTGTHVAPGRAVRRALAGLAATALGFGLAVADVPAAHAATDDFCADGSVRYAPVADVEAFAAGTAVTGLSVTHGSTPDPFTGTYIGFIADALGKGKDMLLFKLSSPVIDGTDASGLKAAGIWAGMSGSPVYDDQNRLIGAVAYSLNADNLPIAGVTPAEYMKSIGTTAVSSLANLKATAANLKVSAAGTRVAGASLTGATLTQVKTVDVAGAAGTKQNEFTNRTLARTPRTAKAGDFLRSGTFRPAAAVAADLTAPLVAGGTVAALYTSGDLTVGAIGTVTAVCGDTVWAFGHPMDYVGRTNLLMANATTAMIVPDSTGADTSYKQVSRIGAPVGTITQDRRVGILGTIGTPNTFGIDVAVQNATGTPVADYHTNVSDQELAATAVAYLTGQAAYEQLDQYDAGTGRVSWTIHFTRADGSTDSLTNSQVAADPDYFPDTIATFPANDVWAITSNEFEDVTVTSVEVTLTLLSADALTYTASGTQVKSGTGPWAALDGTRLKAGGTYSMRPAYKLRRNGRATGSTVVGDAVTVKLSSKARKSGYFRVASTSDSGDECTTDASGATTCEDWSDEPSDESADFADFDDLLATLQDEPSSSDVTGKLYYKLTKGSSSRTWPWTGPGVVSGSARDYFTIKA